MAQGQFGQSQFGAGSVAQGQFGQSQFGAGQFGASTSQFGGAPAQAPNQFAAPADNPQGAFGQQLGQQMQAGFGQQGALVAPAAPPSEANLVPQADIDQAHAAGKINDWENKFYSDLIQKYADIDSFQPSERQMQFKTEIERKVTGQSLGGGEQQGGEDGYSEAWGTSMGDLVAAAGTGKITEWELKFAKDNFTRASFSEKQQAIVDRIRGKLTGEGGAEGRNRGWSESCAFVLLWVSGGCTGRTRISGVLRFVHRACQSTWPRNVAASLPVAVDSVEETHRYFFYFGGCVWHRNEVVPAFLVFRFVLWVSGCTEDEGQWHTACYLGAEYVRLIVVWGRVSTIIPMK